MQILTYVLLGIGVYIGVYSIVDRVCKCVEHGHVSNSFNEFTKVTNESNKKGE